MLAAFLQKGDVLKIRSANLAISNDGEIPRTFDCVSPRRAEFLSNIGQLCKKLSRAAHRQAPTALGDLSERPLHVLQVSRLTNLYQSNGSNSCRGSFSPGSRLSWPRADAKEVAAQYAAEEALRAATGRSPGVLRNYVALRRDMACRAPVWCRAELRDLSGSGWMSQKGVRRFTFAERNIPAHGVHDERTVGSEEH